MRMNFAQIIHWCVLAVSPFKTTACPSLTPVPSETVEQADGTYKPAEPYKCPPSSEDAQWHGTVISGSLAVKAALDLMSRVSYRRPVLTDWSPGDVDVYYGPRDTEEFFKTATYEREQ